MNNSQLINQDSGEYEYYTPIEIIEAARRTMGGIDLDPASSGIANGRVLADCYYDSDGLESVWFGNVWLNHPFSRTTNKLWIDKLVSSYREGAVKQACCITFASTSEKWTQPLFDYPICFLSPRTNYVLPSGEIKKGATKGSMVTYLGPNFDAFCNEFSELGNVMRSYK